MYDRSPNKINESFQLLNDHDSACPVRKHTAAVTGMIASQSDVHDFVVMNNTLIPD